MPAPTVLRPAPAPAVNATAPPGEEVFLTSDELAAWLRVKPDTVRQWRKRQTAPPHDSINGHILYRPSRVKEWIAAQAEDKAA